MNVSSLSEALVKASTEQTGPIQPGSAAGRVYAKLRDSIISLDLPPDTVLSRATIAKEHDVSQSPVREAIQELEKEGLVVSYPQSKTLVTRIDVDHDPTLRKGDIVAGADGLMVARGRAKDARGASLNFSPAPRSVRARFARLPVIASE